MRPVRVVPPASRTVAVSVAVSPTRSAALAGASSTVATGSGVTDSATVPDCPSVLAMMVTGRDAAPV